MARFPFPAGTLCAYCNALKKLTVDHVPPKCLFEKGASDLITVPSCHECHRSFAEDDEYFFHVHVRDPEAQEFPGSEEARKRSQRGLDRPQYRKTAEKLIPKDVPVWAEGEFRGYIQAIEFDGEWIKRTVVRIVKGLFWYENKESLPLDYEVSSFRYDKLDRYDISLQSGLSKMYNHCLSNGKRNVSGGTFEYAFAATDTDHCSTVWVMRFRETSTFDFIAYTHPLRWRRPS